MYVSNTLNMNFLFDNINIVIVIFIMFVFHIANCKNNNNFTCLIEMKHNIIRPKLPSIYLCFCYTKKHTSNSN